MIQALYSGASALSGQTKNIDVIANNVANLNTDGYKKSRLDFEDLLYKTLTAPKPASNGPEKNLQRGNGIKEAQTARIYYQGVLRDTDRVLDFALEGSGFFVVENPIIDEDYGGDADQSVLFIRGGNFHLSVEEDETFLVDNHGRYVLDEDGGRIALPAGMDPAGLQCSASGELSYINDSGQVEVFARLQLADFTNPGGLQDAGNGAYLATDNAGERIEGSCTVAQRKLESSNVDYAEEVTRLIRAQRAFQLASRAVTTADQMMGIANAIRQ